MPSAPVANQLNIQELAAELALSEKAAARAVELAGVRPSGAEWRKALNHFLMAVGVALIIAGITAFFAWNWADLGHLQKFALIQTGIIGSLVAAWRLGIDSVAGSASLFASSFLVGILLAVYGQVYQTGADPYGLFLSWAVLILPWAIIGRQQGIWLLVVVLLNLALIMYWTQVLDPPEGIWQIAQLLGPIMWLGALVSDSELSSALFVLNAMALMAWEVAAARGSSWTQSAWFVRVIAFIAFACVLPPTLLVIFAATFGEGLGVTMLSPVLLAAATTACFFYYQYVKQDLFILTCCALAAILVITSAAVRFVLDDFGSMLFLALLLIVQVAAAAWWLRQVAERWEAAE
jgi:uncharacterized membrane protein